jgi:hypothetical protein
MITCPLDISRTVYTDDHVVNYYGWPSPLVTDNSDINNVNGSIIFQAYEGIVANLSNIDNELLSPSLTLANASISFDNDIGIHIITYVAWDMMGLMSSCSFNITVTPGMI